MVHKLMEETITCPVCGDSLTVHSELTRAQGTFSLDKARTRHPGVLGAPAREQSHGNHSFWLIFDAEPTNNSLSS